MTAARSFETLCLDRVGDVLVVSIDRPAQRNTINATLHGELATVFTVVAADPARAVVLTGKGAQFCFGGDLDWIRNETPQEQLTSARHAQQLIEGLLAVPQPIVAAVNGHAVGLGATLALFCDIVIMSERAKLGDPHVVLGLAAGDGATIAWPAVAGMAIAKRYLLTGDLLTAQEAIDLRLVSEVHAPDDVLPAAMALARRLAELPAPAVQGTKRALNKLLRDSATQSLDAALAFELMSRTSPEHLAALDAHAARISHRGVAAEAANSPRSTNPQLSTR